MLNTLKNLFTKKPKPKPIPTLTEEEVLENYKLLLTIGFKFYPCSTSVVADSISIYQNLRSKNYLIRFNYESKFRHYVLIENSELGLFTCRQGYVVYIKTDGSNVYQDCVNRFERYLEIVEKSSNKNLEKEVLPLHSKEHLKQIKEINNVYFSRL